MLIDIEHISVSFKLRGSSIHAVRDVSFSMKLGETLGIVGESGSGKSVLALSLLQLLPKPPAAVNGKALFDSTDLINCKNKVISSIRGNRISMIFQDPLSSFNPYLRLCDQLIEPLTHHYNTPRKEAIESAIHMLNETGISDPANKVRLFPHQFSGGMLQRAMIAMSLITKPQIIIADEPTTALDVTTQSQILSLMKKLQNQYLMSIIFITHNLGIISGFCDRVNVMYAGTILESSDTRSLFKFTAHPYTKALINSIPPLHSTCDSLYVIGGPPYDPSLPLIGCPFAPRCKFALETCTSHKPDLTEISSGHYTSCIRVKNGEISL